MNNQISLLKWMLEDVRKVTINGVEHLSKEQLFQTPMEGEYCIGSYLMHFAEVDISWLEILSGVPQPEDLKKRSFYDKWFDPSEASAPPDHPMELKEYMEVVDESRKNFLNYISTLDDSELENEVSYKWRANENERKYKKKWIIYHILEHEAHHRGQMFFLIRKTGWNKK